MSDPEFHGIRAKSAIDAFVIAAVAGLLPEMRLFLESGVPVDGVASYNGSPALAAAAGKGQLESVNFLLEHGASIDLPDRNELSPLMLACHLGKKNGSKVALKLIAAGANVNYLRVDDTTTPLMFAVDDGTPELLLALIKAGALVDGPPGAALTPLMMAARVNNVDSLKILVENGADLTLKCGIPWAGQRTAQGLAEMEKQKKAAAYLASVAKK